MPLTDDKAIDSSLTSNSFTIEHEVEVAFKSSLFFVYLPYLKHEREKR